MHLKNMNLTNSAYMDLILPLKTLSQTDGHRPLESPSQISYSSWKHFDQSHSRSSSPSDEQEAVSSCGARDCPQILACDWLKGLFYPSQMVWEHFYYTWDYQYLKHYFLHQKCPETLHLQALEHCGVYWNHFVVYQQYRWLDGWCYHLLVCLQRRSAVDQQNHCGGGQKSHWWGENQALFYVSGSPHPPSLNHCYEQSHAPVLVLSVAWLVMYLWIDYVAVRKFIQFIDTLKSILHSLIFKEIICTCWIFFAYIKFHEKNTVKIKDLQF